MIAPNLQLQHTYRVVLTAMALEEIQRVKYQWRIHQCAQFLADNVDSRGRTRYGRSTVFGEAEPVPTTTRKAVPSKSKSGIFGRKKKTTKPGLHDPNQRIKPRVVKKILVKRRREGPAEYDHSNMQYAALGFRACFDSGITFEKELIESIQQRWVSMQEQDETKKKETLHLDSLRNEAKKGGISRLRRSRSTSVKQTVRVAPQGWGYGEVDTLRGSMVVGAVGAMCIYDYILGKDWRKNTDILEGMQWINKNFTVTENPMLGDEWHYYYLYGLERAGMLFGTETIGSHKWYRTGAEYLLKEQGPGGKWNSEVDTCFAILFLQRATRSLSVASGVRRR